MPFCGGHTERGRGLEFECLCPMDFEWRASDHDSASVIDDIDL